MRRKSLPCFMDNDEGDVSRRKIIAAGTAHDTRDLARVKRHPRLLFRGIQLSLEHGVKFHKPRFITLYSEKINRPVLD